MKVDDQTYRDALDYGRRIIIQEPQYNRFAMALMDYAGEDVCPYCKDIFKEIIRSMPKKCLDDIDEGACGCFFIDSDDEILSQFKELRTLRDEDRKENFGDDVDELQFLNADYRCRDDFRQMLDFVGRHAFMTPYNAVLAYMQKPESTFVFDGDTWREKQGRQPRRGARKLISIAPSGHVQCLFDYADTEPIPGSVNSLFDFMFDIEDRWKEVLKDVRRRSVNAEFNTLVRNLPVYGVFLDWTIEAEESFGGYIKTYRDRILKVDIVEPVHSSFRHNAHFRIRVNKRFPKEEAFYIICREMARVLCRHLCYDGKKANARKLTVKEREFEIETVLWMVFRRMGIHNPSEDYLERFERDGMVPLCSIVHITRAVAEMEKMLGGDVPACESLLYREDDVFRQNADDAVKNAGSHDSCSGPLNLFTDI